MAALDSYSNYRVYQGIRLWDEWRLKCCPHSSPQVMYPGLGQGLPGRKGAFFFFFLNRKTLWPVATHIIFQQPSLIQGWNLTSLQECIWNAVRISETFFQPGIFFNIHNYSSVPSSMGLKCQLLMIKNGSRYFRN